MHIRINSYLSMTGLLLGIMLAPASAADAAAQSRSTTVTRADGRTATSTTSYDRDASDGTVGATRVVTGFDGRTATASRGTVTADGTVQRSASRTGLGGRTASYQGTYTRDNVSRTRTTRSGATYTRSRHR